MQVVEAGEVERPLFSFGSLHLQLGYLRTHVFARGLGQQFGEERLRLSGDQQVLAFGLAGGQQAGRQGGGVHFGILGLQNEGTFAG